jgi:hypothetical protein
MNPIRLYLLVLIAAVPAFACSGPGAQRTMLTAQLIGFSAGAFTLGVAVFLMWKMREFKLHFPTFLLAALHPGWWVSAYAGDCGIVRMGGTLLFALPLALIVVVAVLKYRRNLDS